MMNDKILLCIVIFTFAQNQQISCSELCSDVNGFIDEFRIKIQYEKKNLPDGGELKNASINYIVEFSSDVQRTIEYIGERLNITSLTDDERESLTESVGSCASYQELIAECEFRETHPECDPESPFRTHDGTCNNLEHPTWGSTLAPFTRLLPPSYEGLSQYRQSVAGGPLPDPRNLSLNLLHGETHSAESLSQLFMVFGQLITHDLGDAALPKVNGLPPLCCAGYEYMECDPVAIATTDPFYSTYNMNCLQFLRHAPFTTCGFTKREHMNSVPAFLDCHITYGRNEEEAMQLRTDDGTGRLKSQKTPDGESMMKNTSQDDQFCPAGANYPDACFFGGDSRVNQHTTLMALETVFLREHNRMAGELKKINPDWDGEKIYQVARKILGAKMQCLTYNEYLPLLLGPRLVEEHGLKIGGPATSYYDPSLIPSVSSEFSSFAFRLHGTVGTQVADRGCARALVRDTYSNPQPIHDGCAGDYLKGAGEIPQKEMEPPMVEDVTELLYINLTSPAGTGLDLGAIDIKRGRDRGMPSYSEFVEFVSQGTISISSFSDLQKLMSKDRADLLQQNYVHPGDIDVWVGMVMEEHLPGSLLGPTAANFTIEQFQRTKRADRFYFENRGLPTSFTEGQIQQLRSSTLSKLICDNTDVSEMPRNALLLPNSVRNPMVPCDEFPSVNLDFWKGT